MANFSNFISNLGAGFKGVQDYQTWLQEQETAKQQNAMRAMQNQVMQQQMQDQQTARQDQSGIDSGMLKLLSQIGQQQQPEQVPPSPGQASTPMQPPTMQYPQGGVGGGMGRLQGNPGISLSGIGGGSPQDWQTIKARSQQGAQGNNSDMLSILQNEFKNEQDPANKAAIGREIGRIGGAPPYQSMSGVKSPATEELSLPAPPASVKQPQKGSWSLQDASKYVESLGDLKPSQKIAIINKVYPLLTEEAKMQSDAKKLEVTEQLKAKQAEIQEMLAAMRVEKTGADIKRSEVKSSNETTDAETRRLKSEKQEPAEPLTPEGKKLAEELIKAGKPLPGGWSKTGIARGNSILNDMAKNQEGGAGSGSIVGAQSEYKGNQAALTQLTKDLTAIRPYKVMLDTNADIAIDLGKELIKSNSKLANKTINWVKQNAGDNPDTADYLAQIHFVQTEASRVLSNPRLVGQLTDSARKDMQSIIDGDMPIESTERVLQRIKKDGDNRVNAMEKEKESVVSSFKSKPSSGTKVFSNKAELESAIKSGKIKKGDTFNDPDGNPHVVN